MGPARKGKQLCGPKVLLGMVKPWVLLSSWSKRLPSPKLRADSNTAKGSKNG